MSEILLLDDQKINLDLLETIITLIDNFKINKFTSPLEALNWCEYNTPDIAIIDYMMPDLTGIEWTEKFRALKKGEEIPIIMITAYYENEIKNKALQAGINDFLPKPFDSTELVARITNMKRIREYSLKLQNKANILKGEVDKAVKQIIERENEIIFRLAKATEFRDDDTYNHILRMSHYAYHIAKNLGFNEEFCLNILKAAPMHDVGKVGVPDSILFKPGRLTKEEFNIIKQHSQIGYNILSNSNIPLLDLSAEIALTHHEKFDGSGYPNRLKEKEIPISGRICAVADVFDALTSNRPYKKAWDIEKAIEELVQCKGTHFDPDCVDAFLKDFDNVLKIKEKYRD